MATGEEVHEDADGRRKQINADGSVLVAEAPPTPPPQSIGVDVAGPVLVAEAPPTPPPQSIGDGVGVRQVDPKELFAEHMERAKSGGNAVVSEVDRRGSRKVIFEDGGKLVLTKEGIMIHKYADGKKDQCTPDGKRVTVRCRHSVTWICCGHVVLAVLHPPAVWLVTRPPARPPARARVDLSLSFPFCPC